MLCLCQDIAGRHSTHIINENWGQIRLQRDVFATVKPLFVPLVGSLDITDFPVTVLQIMFIAYEFIQKQYPLDEIS